MQKTKMFKYNKTIHIETNETFKPNHDLCIFYYYYNYNCLRQFIDNINFLKRFLFVNF